MMDPTWITTLAADPTFVLSSEPNWLDYAAPAIAAVSASVIAWQAVLTRRSLKASNRAVDASEQAVAVAQRTLELNQVARIEASVPRIWLTVGDVGTLVTESGTRVPSETVFKLPRDAERKLTTRGRVTIHNDGPGSAELAFSKELKPVGTRSRVRLAILEEGRRFDATYAISRSVENWVDLAKEERKADEDHPAQSSRLVVRYKGPRDADIVERHVVRVYNSVLVEDESSVGDWRLAESSQLTAEVEPSVREYWRSQSAGEKFEF